MLACESASARQAVAIWLLFLASNPQDMAASERGYGQLNKIYTSARGDLNGSPVWLD